MNLLTSSNPKTKKGEDLGYMTFILHLAPNTMNDKGQNLCPMATKGCIVSCLNTAGMGGIFQSVKDSRRKKSNYFVNDRSNFLNDLYYEISISILKAKKNNLIPVFRLNGTSDIQWENIKMKDNKTVFELFPDITFYDYTKIANRFNKKLPANYHLTFSYSAEKDYYSGRIDQVTKDILSKGYNVSVVFGGELPKTFLGYEVVNGDETDLRFTDKNKIIGLKAKGKAKYDKTGFVIK